MDAQVKGNLGQMNPGDLERARSAISGYVIRAASMTPPVVFRVVLGRGQFPQLRATERLAR